MSIGGFISSIFGSENKDKVANTAKPVDLNRNDYHYGGQPGGADEAANRYRAQAEQAQGRTAPQADFQYSQPNYNNAAQWGNLVSGDRGGQSQTANMMLSRAMGQQPSIAGMQAHQDIAQLQLNAQQQSQQAQAQQASQAASARGAGGMALAQQNAANNMANTQGAIGHGVAQATQNISNQAQVNAANERMQAEQAANGAFTGMRAGDTGMVNDEAQRAQFGADLASKQAMFNTGMRSDAAARNDAMTNAMANNERGVRTAEMTGGMNYGAQQSGNTMGADSINAGVGGQNASMNQSNSLSLIGLAAKGAGGVAGAMADGGPVHAHKPYLVGERGPELVVPKQDGVVIPHEQTRRVINVSPQIISDKPDAADTVLSTWGTGPGMTKQQADSANGARGLGVESRDLALAKTSGRSGGQAVEGLSPGLGGSPAGALQRADEERIMLAKAKQAEGAELTPDEERRLGGANFRAGNDRKAAPKATLASRLGSMGDSTMRNATQVDTSYHGPGGGYVPPQLIQVAGPRAAGGPVEAGQPYLVGEQGPELMAPKTGIGMDMAPKLSVPSAAMLDLGGAKGAAGPTAAPGMQDAVSKSWQPQDGTGKTAMRDDMAHREDGGPVEKGKPYVTGEKGPELVVPDRQMQSFQRDVEPRYVDPRFPDKSHDANAERHRQIAAAGDFVTALMNPSVAVYRASQEAGTDAGALAARAANNAEQDAGSIPKRGLATAMGGGAKTLETASTESIGKRSYETPLSGDEEKAFASWKARYAPNDSGADYDLRGAFKAGFTPDPRSGHWPDTFKKPNHETFSDESIYATGPDAEKAGRWEGETFIPPGPKEYAPSPHPLPPPPAPRIEPTPKPEKRTLAATMGRASISGGRARRK